MRFLDNKKDLELKLATSKSYALELSSHVEKVVEDNEALSLKVYKLSSALKKKVFKLSDVLEKKESEIVEAIKAATNAVVKEFKDFLTLGKRCLSIIIAVLTNFGLEP
ncbi:unnamed protein product [Ilex paraguariensis]|uniref:Uncharacterized protein n=1 Tax=Ilex paraguariensis TaxID=185542 RepID=A0ABC8RXX3_9AQUA